MPDDFHGSLNETRVIMIPPPKTRVPRLENWGTQGNDLRTKQARILWDNGWGRARFPSFDVYVSTIPMVPKPPQEMRFAQPVLVDTSLSLSDACRMLGVAFSGDESVFSLPPSRLPDAEVYWMWVNVEPGNEGVTPFHVMHACAEDTTGLTAYEGIALIAQNMSVLMRSSLCLAGSRLCSFPAYCACLMTQGGQPTLGVTEYCTAGEGRQTPLRWC